MTPIRRPIRRALRRDFLLRSCAALAAAATPFGLHAQASPPYPARPVRVIVPFAPGGPNDLAARLIAQGLAEHFGKPFNVDNIGGAGGNIGVGQAARAAPDGHTVLIAAASYAINPSLFDKLPYDPYRDFSAVTIAATAPTVLTVHPSVAARTVDELVSAIKASPGSFSYASPGPGTPPHLLGELFRMAFQLDLVHVPFNGGGPAIASTVAGHTPLSFGALPPAVQHVKEGKLKALAITSKARAPALPQIPTMAESGYPDIAADIWTAVLVPTGTATAQVNSLHRAVVETIARPDIRDRMAGFGYVPVGNAPAECDAEIRREITKWAKVIREAGIKV
jgi:tripartite-type tricarboxylate transporter receptor subunit TctC